VTRNSDPVFDRFRDAHSETEKPNYRNVDMDP